MDPSRKWAGNVAMRMLYDQSATLHGSRRRWECGWSQDNKAARNKGNRGWPKTPPPARSRQLIIDWCSTWTETDGGSRGRTPGSAWSVACCIYIFLRGRRIGRSVSEIVFAVQLAMENFWPKLGDETTGQSDKQQRLTALLLAVRA